MNASCFDILSNEEISNIIAYLDAVSLFHFCGCSSRLLEFNNISNDHWRKLYSIQWFVEEEELRLYEDMDWKAEFKSRLTLENKTRQNIHGNEFDRNLRSLLRSVTSTDTVAALDKILEETVMNTPAIFVATAILRLTRRNELPLHRAFEYVATLFTLALKKNVVIGVLSVVVALLDLKYNNTTLLETLRLLQDCGSKPRYNLGDSANVRYLALESRLLDIIEKSSSLELIKNAMDAFTFSVDIGNRPALCQKICQVIDQCSNPDSDLGMDSKARTLATIKDFLGRLVDKNSEFLVAQGVLQKLFDSIPKLSIVPFYVVMTTIETFTYEKAIANKVAKDEVLMNFILDHAKKLRSNTTLPTEEFTIFDGVFGFFYSLMYCRNVEHLFNSPYLDYVLPYLEKEEIGDTVFSHLCSVLSQYIRYGIETLRLNSIHRRLEPYLQTVINSPFFKHSITLWQTLYCGMKLPLDLAKSLIERIIPELPFETDKRINRSYAELLANMVQVDRAPFFDIDMKILYDYYSRQLIIDDRTNDPGTRGKVPFACNFIAAGSSVQQFAELAIKDLVLLEKMYSLYDEQKEVNETIYLVVNFFSYVVKIPGWDNRRGLELLERWGTTMPLKAPMYYMFTMIDSFMHLFARDNPVEMLLFGTWIIARMSQRQDGRDGLRHLSSDTLEWLLSHPDPRIRKNMNYYQQNIYRAQMGYVDEY